MITTPPGSKAFYPRCRAIFEVLLDGVSFGPGSEDEPMRTPVLPKAAKVHINGYQQADSWELGFDYRDLPFDPNLVRVGAVEIYFYDATGMQDDTAVLSRQFTLTAGGGIGADSTELVSGNLGLTDRKKFTGAEKPTTAGLFDDHSINLSDDGKWVTISGQDYTSLFIAKQWPPTDTGRARRIPIGRRLDVWVKMIVMEVDPEEKFSVVFRDLNVKDLPIVGAAEVSSHKRGIPVQQNTSYWDVLYKVITRHGYICYMRGYDLIVTKPKNLDDIAEHTIRSMAWGKNLQSVQLTRHLGKQKVPRVIIHAYDDKSKKMLVIEEPDNAPKHAEAKMLKTPSKRTTSRETIRATTARKSAKKPKAKTEKLTDEQMVIPVYGIKDKEALRRAAKMMRTLIGRGERKIVAKTRDLVDVDGHALLDIETGDPFYIEWQDFNAEVLGNPGFTMETRIAYLTARGFRQNVAKAIATSYQRLIGRQRPLRFREGTIDYSIESGIDIEMELVDFIMVDGVRDRSIATPRQELNGILHKVGLI